MQTNLEREKEDQRLLGYDVVRKEQKGRLTKEHEKTFWGDGYIHILDCSDGFVKT